MMRELREVRENNVEQKKGKNRGFSLVELIVVIAIMAILAVVIAPQVIKYIGKSKDSVDAANISLYKTAANTALADEAVYSQVAGLSSNLVITVKPGATPSDANVVTYTPAVNKFQPEFNEILNGSYPLPKSPTKTFFEITIEVTGNKVGTINVEAK